jgi:ABC-type sugar transport system substrate-binding protein
MLYEMHPKRRKAMLWQERRSHIVLTLLSLVIVLSMLLSACVTPTPAPPATEAPPAAEEPAAEEPAAEEPAAEEPAAEEPAEEATPEPEEEMAEEPAAEADAVKIGFLAGVQDPFYFTMQRGAEQAAADFGAELIVQIPEDWNATVQTPMLDAMVARGDLDFLFLAPVRKLW